MFITDKSVLKKLEKNLVVVTENYKIFNGHKCTCGYSLEEGDYQLKGRKDDFVNYHCENCKYEMTVYLYELPNLD